MEHIEEAIKAKDMAEEKFASKDYEGAVRFALKAQALCPSPESFQMVATFSIYLSSTIKIGSENDWYSILSAPMSMDDETLRKQHIKLFFLIRPDINKTVGAHGAFQKIQEAWTVLSNKETRALYDQKVLQM